MSFGRKINPEKDKGDENSQENNHDIEENLSSQILRVKKINNVSLSAINSFSLYDSFFIDLKVDDCSHLPYFLQEYSLFQECITDYQKKRNCCVAQRTCRSNLRFEYTL